MTTDRLRTPAVSNDPDGDVGVDAKYGVTANLTADVTVNTDFAQVEVDEQQVNLTRFSAAVSREARFLPRGPRHLRLRDGSGGGGGGGAAGGGNSSPTNGAPTLFYSRRIGLNARPRRFRSTSAAG